MAYENIMMKVELRDGISYVNYQAEVLLKKKKGTNKQNFYSFLSKVSIRNDSLIDIEDAVLTISSDWPCLLIEDTHISDIQVKKTTEIDAFTIYLNAMELYKLNSPIITNLTFRLLDKEGECIFSTVEALKVLPIEEAASDIIGDRLDILSSFVTPECDEVKKLAKTASNIMESLYNRKDFAGYQYHDPNKVKEEAHAAFVAVQSVGVRYSEPPASFEKTFQKVRLPYQVIKEKVGTCLDLSLLYCSVLESIGLNPLLFLVSGHAYAGVMLDEETLPHNVEDNTTLLTNGISDGINKILVINPTDATSSTVAIPFEHSINNAKVYTLNGSGLRAIDIYLSHRGETLPIPTPHEVSLGEYSVDISLLDKSYQETIEKIDLEHRGIVMSRDDYSPKDKFEYWEEKLLDLNLKNKLINFKFQKNGVEFIVPDCVQFINFLASRERALIECPATTIKRHDGHGPFLFSKAEQGDIAWKLAYHAYSEPLTDPSFWTAGARVTDDIESQMITMKNLTVLTDYLKDTYGPEHTLNLSEVGYTSSQGQEVQAAAIAYAFYLCQANDMVDCLIIHRHCDAPSEVAEGLALGLWGNSSGVLGAATHRKQAWTVLQQMDQNADYTAFAPAVIGAQNWQELIPQWDEIKPAPAS
ncbi:MAG: DUF5722 domain-containing protein [Bacilli bacterium]|nr:DUF5722 domain-containing protein [Bacilli bacterium]